jgi:hypothetical protein
MQYIANPTDLPHLAILNILPGSETSEATRQSELTDFLHRYKETGAVVFFYESLQNQSNPCTLTLTSLHRLPDLDSCRAIYPAKSVEQFVRHEFLSEGIRG